MPYRLDFPLSDPAAEAARLEWCGRLAGEFVKDATIACLRGDHGRASNRSFLAGVYARLAERQARHQPFNEAVVDYAVLAAEWRRGWRVADDGLAATFERQSPGMSFIHMSDPERNRDDQSG